MAKRHQIPFNTMDAEEVFDDMTEKNELAAYYLVEIYTKHKDGHGILLDLDDMNIRGEQIVIGIKKVCNGSIKDFVHRVLRRDPHLVTSINLHHSKHKAVVRNASFAEDRE